MAQAVTSTSRYLSYYKILSLVFLFIPVADSLSPNEIASTKFDVILSSGFLCLSRHAGFAASLEDLGLTTHVERYAGTSSGALAASMMASGMNAREIAKELSIKSPLAQCRLALKPWRGVLSTRAVQRRLELILPPTFEDLPKPLAVGVYDIQEQSLKFITSGKLAPAVAASFAVPGGLFSPVRLEDGRLYADGGALDRTFVRSWKNWNAKDDKQRKALLHFITSKPPEVYTERDGIDDDCMDDLLFIVRSPRTKAKLWSLKDFDGEVEFTRFQTTEALCACEPLKSLIVGNKF